MRGGLAESEIRALRCCYPNRANQTFYMQEIIASILGENECIVIYVANDFIEIALIKDSKIIKLFVKESALSALRYAILNFVDEHNLKIGEQTLTAIINDFFCGKDTVIHGSSKSTCMPIELRLSSKDILSISSHWVDTVKNYIEGFIKNNNFVGNLYLMSDFDNVDFLIRELSSRGVAKIRSINNALEKIAINLSLR